MVRIVITLSLAALLAGCASYTERKSPCVCGDWEPINAKRVATV